MRQMCFWFGVLVVIGGQRTRGELAIAQFQSLTVINALLFQACKSQMQRANVIKMFNNTNFFTGNSAK